MTKEEAREAIKEAYGNSEYTDEIINALEQEPILDKISDEIESLIRGALTPLVNVYKVLDIIDKYKAESEGICQN